jgi:hypothetical protein
MGVPSAATTHSCHQDGSYRYPSWVYHRRRSSNDALGISWRIDFRCTAAFGLGSTTPTLVRNLHLDGVIDAGYTIGYPHGDPSIGLLSGILGCT